MSVADGRIGDVERPTELLAQHATALAERLTELNWAGPSATNREVADGLTDTALIEAIERIGAVANLVDAVGIDPRRSVRRPLRPRRRGAAGQATRREDRGRRGRRAPDAVDAGAAPTRRLKPPVPRPSSSRAG